MKRPILLLIPVTLSAFMASSGLADEPSSSAAKPAAPQGREIGASDSTLAAKRTQEASTAKEAAERPRANETRAENHPISKGNPRSGVKAPASRHPITNRPQLPRGQSQHQVGGRGSNAETGSKPGAVADLHQPRLNSSKAGVDVESPMHRTENRPGTPAAELRNPILPSQSVPPRGQTVASIGGPATPNSRNAAVLNGSSIRRKP